MSVKELKEQLNKYPEDRRVCVEIFFDETFYSDNIEEVFELELDMDDPKEGNIIIIQASRDMLDPFYKFDD